jgi:hypothetical protein
VRVAGEAQFVVTEHFAVVFFDLATKAFCARPQLRLNT